MELLKLTRKVYKYYIENVKGNENTTYDQTRRKLNRNVLLAKEVIPDDKFHRFIGSRAFMYGNLYILVRRNKIIHLRNTRGKNVNKDWQLDKERYKFISKEFGVEDSKFGRCS